MHIEMPHLLMVSYLGKRPRSIDNKCAFVNKKYAIKADNRQCFTSSKQPIQQALNNSQHSRRVRVLHCQWSVMLNAHLPTGSRQLAISPTAD